MSKQATAGWGVRFLSGSLRGRTIALKPGANVVGSGSDCDIMLSGDILPRHFVFTVGDIAVSIRRIGTAVVRLNGEELSIHRRGAVRGDIVSLGDIDFELDWLEAVDGPSPQRVEPDAAAETEHIGASLEADDEEYLGLDLPPSRPRYRAALVIAAAVGIFAIAAGIGLRTTGYLGATVHAGVGGKVDAAVLEAALVDFPDIKVAANSDGTALVKGYVTSSARKSALLGLLEPFGKRVSADIHITDEILQRARGFLNDPNLTVTYAGRGRIVVSGRSESELIRQKIKRLGQDLLPAVAVLDSVQYGGVLSDAQVAAGELSAWQNSLPSRMVGLTEYTNGLRYIQLANGQRYYEGSTLKSGGELTRIEADRLVVTGGSAPQASVAETGAPKRPE